MTVKFNGLGIPNFIKVTGVSFQTLPTLTILESEAPRRIGNIDSGVKRGGVTITLSIILRDKNKNIHQQSDEIKKWLIGDNWKPSNLIFDEQPNKYYVARAANSVDINDLFTHGESEIEFYAADPIKYEVTETSVNSASGVTTITYTGLEKAPTKLVIQITSPCTNITIKNTKNNSNTTLLGVFSIGQSITIDSYTRKVLVNGTPSMKLLSFESDWPYLEAGTNKLTLTVGSGTVNNYQVKYRKAD